MRLKFNRYFFWYSSISFVLFLSLLVALGGYHWSIGTFDIEQSSAIYESSYKLDELINKKPLDYIYNSVSSDRVQEAIDKQRDLSANIVSLSNSLHEQPQALHLSLKNVQKDLSTLLTTHEVFNIFSILKKRVRDFNKFVISNNWRTLTRLSERIISLIDENKLRRPNFFQVKSVGPLIRSIQRTVNLMESVTKSSVLTEENKGLILARLQKMQIELDMLKKYLVNLRQFQVDYKTLKMEFTKWLKDLRPNLAYAQIKRMQQVKMFYLQSVALLGIGILLFVIGIFVYYRSEKKNYAQVENLILDQVQEGLIPLKGKNLQGASEHFSVEFSKLRDYVHKRMSLGKLFQEAIPLSSILLDSNLNVIWGNDLFYETWRLEDIKERGEQVTWDYLLQYTNLGDQDPVVDALKNGVAGIYHIQLKLFKDRSEPFEMYVSPIEYLGETRIMMMFYPLQSFEETIRNQSAAIVGPVKKTIDALMSANFDHNFVEEIKKDFEIANIEHILQSFIEFNEFNTQLKHELASEIKYYKELYEDRVKQLDSSSALLLEKQSALQQMMDELKVMKRNFVDYVASKTEQEDIYQELLGLQQGVGQEYESLIMQSEELNRSLVDTYAAFEKVIALKGSFKQVTQQIQIFREELLQLIDKNLLEIKGHELTPVRQHELLLEMKNRVKQIDDVIYLYGKLTTKLDVAFSKVQMIADGQKQIDLTEVTERVETLFDNIKNNSKQAEELVENNKEQELAVVENIRSFYLLFKEILEMHKELKRLLAFSLDAVKDQPIMKGTVAINSSDAITH